MWFKNLFKKKATKPTIKDAIASLDSIYEKFNTFSYMMQQVDTSSSVTEERLTAAKLKEFNSAGAQASNGLENMRNHLITLKNWKHTPPPIAKDLRPVENDTTDYVVHDDDQMFLNKLEDAKNASILHDKKS